MRLSEDWTESDPDGEYAEVDFEQRQLRANRLGRYYTPAEVRGYITGQSLKNLAQEKRPHQLTPLNRLVRGLWAVLCVVSIIGIGWLFLVWFLTLGGKP